MAKIKDQPDSRFLHAEDLLQGGEWRQYALTIDRVIPPGELKYQNGQMADCYVLCFKETQKMFSLAARCNWRLMPYAVGSAKPENWPGKRITVYAARGSWFGEDNLAAVRIRPLPGARPKLSPKDLGEDLTGVKLRPLEQATEDEKQPA